jgi:Holliday junction resolvasome RuvABC DNA-binding subunit
MLLGAALVVLGVLAGGIADRIRHGSATTGNVRRTHERSPRPGAVALSTPAHERMARDVVAALVSSGYSKPEATKAVGACAGAECATLESWVRAALRRAMKVEAA